MTLMRFLPGFARCMALSAAGFGALAAAQSPAPKTEAEQIRRVHHDEPRALYEAVSAVARTCAFFAGIVDLPMLPTFHHRMENRSLLRRMLESDRPDCPDLPARTAAFIHAAIGTPERADVDLDLLALGRQAAERGQGMVADPALADRYGRMLWLFHSPPPDLPRWPDAERRAWLMRPETVALLRARIADAGLRTPRAESMLADLLLSGDFPGRDPEEALAVLGPDGDPLRISRLLSDGKHFRPDHARAAQAVIGDALDIRSSQLRDRGQLLHIGRLAADAARTPVEQAQALRILSAATLDEYFGRREGVSALLRRIGPVPQATLAETDAALIERTMTSEARRGLPSGPGLRPTVLRVLIGPDGRMVMTEVARSSGAASLDHALRALWITLGTDLDLSATAQGRFVWATLPPVERCDPCTR